jgi:hypothetical protein
VNIVTPWLGTGKSSTSSTRPPHSPGRLHMPPHDLHLDAADAIDPANCSPSSTTG